MSTDELVEKMCAAFYAKEVEHATFYNSPIPTWEVLHEDYKAEYRDSMRAALAVVPMTEWQPIETAPKDGAAFIGLCDGLVYRVKWAQYYVKWPHEEGGPTFRGGWSAETSDQMFGCNPILWVPIPPERAGK